MENATVMKHCLFPIPVSGLQVRAGDNNFQRCAGIAFDRGSAAGSAKAEGANTVEAKRKIAVTARNLVTRERIGATNRPAVVAKVLVKW